jgi:hypothetical protein
MAPPEESRAPVVALAPTVMAPEAMLVPGPRREFSFLVNEFTDPGIGLTGDGVGAPHR